MRIFKRGHVLAVLLVVTFGLFLVTTLGVRGAAPEPGTDMTVTIFTDLPSQPDAPPLGFGGVMLGLAALCGLLGFVSATLAALATRTVRRCTARADLCALLN